jgi:hypothetical protein
VILRLETGGAKGSVDVGRESLVGADSQDCISVDVDVQPIPTSDDFGLGFSQWVEVLMHDFEYVSHLRQGETPLPRLCGALDFLCGTLHPSAILRDSWRPEIECHRPLRPPWKI